MVDFLQQSATLYWCEGITILAVCLVKATLSGRCNLALENLALRQQLAILKRTQKRPAISSKDRLFWVWLSRIWFG